ncbi:hypothetical protein TRFO_22974 [Tritrichomonas foetus]|uniref:Uncharacterized protein n=1 Tax=Tritrichomonas foetus TaxID=1144522 RepID=A0A1J4KAK9_9EUKA|nr:hypothetical protein TRFO_22974 [Tritrichomonas foetus]|eukprot:OHT08471.1 hypothetical protein TRFO_22974 [Tritrichomonas foetus]
MSEMIYGKHSRFGGKVGYMLENDDVDMFMDFFNCQKIINRSWNEYQVTNTLFEDCWIDPNLIKISREFPGERMHLNEMVLASGSIKILKYMILQNFMISKLFSTNLLSFSAISPNNKYCEIVHLVENYIPDISTWHDTDEEENLLLSIIKRLDHYNPDKVNQVEPLDVCMSVKTRRKNLMEYWIDLIDMHNVESQEMVQKYNMLYHAFIGALGVCNISVIDYLLGIISDEIEKYFSNHQKETTDNDYDENLIMFWLIMYLVSCDIYFPENKFFMIHPIRTMFMKLGINCNYKTPNKHTIFSSSISSGLLPLFPLLLIFKTCL